MILRQMGVSPRRQLLELVTPALVHLLPTSTALPTVGDHRRRQPADPVLVEAASAHLHQIGRGPPAGEARIELACEPVVEHLEGESRRNEQPIQNLGHDGGWRSADHPDGLIDGVLDLLPGRGALPGPGPLLGPRAFPGPGAFLGRGPGVPAGAGSATGARVLTVVDT